MDQLFDFVDDYNKKMKDTQAQQAKQTTHPAQQAKKK